MAASSAIIRRVDWNDNDTCTVVVRLSNGDVVAGAAGNVSKHCDKGDLPCAIRLVWERSLRAELAMNEKTASFVNKPIADLLRRGQ
jgi:hypothetical protein